MSGLPTTQPISGLSSSLRSGLLRRTGDSQLAQAQRDLAIPEALDPVTGQPAVVESATSATGSASVDDAATAATTGTTGGAALQTVQSGDASTSAVAGATSGDTLATDPLHILPNQPLPGLVDTGDAVALLLGAGIVPSELTDEDASSQLNFPGGAPQDPFAGIPTDQLARGDLDSQINERIEIIPVAVSPASLGNPEFAPQTAVVIPAIPNQPTPNVGSGQSDVLNSFQLRSSRDANNQQRQRRSAGLDS